MARMISGLRDPGRAIFNLHCLPYRSKLDEARLAGAECVEIDSQPTGQLERDVLLLRGCGDASCLLHDVGVR